MLGFIMYGKIKVFLLVISFSFFGNVYGISIVKSSTFFRIVRFFCPCFKKNEEESERKLFSKRAYKYRVSNKPKITVDSINEKEGEGVNNIELEKNRNNLRKVLGVPKNSGKFLSGCFSKEDENEKLELACEFDKELSNRNFSGIVMAGEVKKNEDEVDFGYCEIKKSPECNFGSFERSSEEKNNLSLCFKTSLELLSDK